MLNFFKVLFEGIISEKPTLIKKIKAVEGSNKMAY